MEEKQDDRVSKEDFKEELDKALIDNLPEVRMAEVTNTKTYHQVLDGIVFYDDGDGGFFRFFDRSNPNMTVDYPALQLVAALKDAKKNPVSDL